MGFDNAFEPTLQLMVENLGIVVEHGDGAVAQDGNPSL